MRYRLAILAAALVAVAALAGIGYVLFAPKTLRVAVGPMSSPDVRVVVGFMQALQRERASIRLKLVLTEGPAESAAAFRNGQAQLAVMRADMGMPDTAMTVAILRNDAVYLLARANAGIAKFRDLAGRKIGIVSPRPANEAVLKRILQHHGLAVEDITIVRGSTGEIVQAAREGRVDAVFVVAPSSERFGRLVYAALQESGGKAPKILPIGDGEVLAADNPGLTETELPAGSLGGDPAQPEEETTTLAVSHRLVARRSISEETVAELTKLLFGLRLAIAAETPAANQLELPSTESRGPRLPIHPGTIAYIEGETRTFFERYGDWFYLGIMGFSIVGSVLAAFWSRLTNARPPVNIRHDLAELVRLIGAARGAGEPAALAALEAEADSLRAELATAIIVNEPDSDQIAAIRFLLSELDAVLDRKRAELAPER